MNIIEAYIRFGWVFALLHFLLFATCVSLWIVEYNRRKKEQRAYESLEGDGFDAISIPEDTEVGKLASIGMSMVKKGEMLSQSAVTLRLNQALGRHESLVRAILNAFVISGLLGTLYNLWRLAPNFWEGLVTGQGRIGQPSIGLAFSVSIFGLTYALVLTLFHAVAVRGPREAFISRVVNGVFDATARRIPPKEGAAVAQALENFYDASKGFLTELKVKHEEVSQQFVRQVQDSSTQLIQTLNTVGTQWQTLAGEAKTSITNTGRKLDTEVEGLIAVTSATRDVLGTTLSRLEQSEEISRSLLQTYAQANLLVSDIGTELNRFNSNWNASLDNLSRAHAARLESTSGEVSKHLSQTVLDSSSRLESIWIDVSSRLERVCTEVVLRLDQVSTEVTSRLELASTHGWERYNTEAAIWHKENAQSMDRFATGIEQSISTWAQERVDLDSHIRNLVHSWQEAINQTVNTMEANLSRLESQTTSFIQSFESALASSTGRLQSGLGDLRHKSDELTTTTSELAASLRALQTTAYQQLEALEKSIKNFSGNFSTGNPFGEAMTDISKAIYGLEQSIARSGANASVESQSSAQLYEIKNVLHRMANSIEQIRLYSSHSAASARTTDDSSRGGVHQLGADQNAPHKVSGAPAKVFWMWRPWRKLVNFVNGR